MDTGYCLKDEKQCRLCEPTFYRIHKIVPFKLRFLRTTLYKKHSSKLCELYCEKCDIPISVHSVPLHTQFEFINL